MTKEQWQAFSTFRAEFRKKTNDWMQFAPELIPLEKNAAEKDTPPYPLQTPVVYNRALDEITPETDIKLIVIGDNPGKDEQLEKNNKYLVGQSGKIAEGFFRRNSELDTDFRKNVIILNKTPVHTAKTNHLKALSQNSGQIADLIQKSQLWMAEHTAKLHQELASGGTELWLVGYSELKDKGIFTSYRDALYKAYANNPDAWNSVYVFQHFSMNRFLIDLTAYQEKHKSKMLNEAIHELGAIHRGEIFQ